MYSYEDRIRAIELYLKLGKRQAATLRQLGYPTKNSLKSWYQEFLEHGDLQVGYSKSKQKYSIEQKDVAVKHYLSHGCCFSVTLKALQYPGRATLTKWVRERHPETRKCVVGKVAKQPASLSYRRAVVYELCTRECSAQALAQKLDVDRVTLYNWKNQLLGREAPALMKPDKHQQAEADRTELQQEVESLRRDIRKLQLEHDLLKKANEILKNAPHGSLNRPGFRGGSFV